MATQQQPQIKLEYVDLPEIGETYVDTLEKVFFNGQILRLEFCVTRMNNPDAEKTMTGKKYPACRLVMSPSGLVEIVNKLAPLVNALEKQGILKKGAPPTAAPAGGAKLKQN